jgi:hypothetical protein
MYQIIRLYPQKYVQMNQFKIKMKFNNNNKVNNVCS